MTSARRHYADVCRRRGGFRRCGAAAALALAFAMSWRSAPVSWLPLRARTAAARGKGRRGVCGATRSPRYSGISRRAPLLGPRCLRCASHRCTTSGASARAGFARPLDPLLDASVPRRWPNARCPIKAPAAATRCDRPRQVGMPVAPPHLDRLGRHVHGLFFTPICWMFWLDCWTTATFVPSPDWVAAFALTGSFAWLQVTPALHTDADRVRRRGGAAALGARSTFAARCGRRRHGRAGGRPCCRRAR